MRAYVLKRQAYGSVEFIHRNGYLLYFACQLHTTRPEYRSRKLGLIIYKNNEMSSSTPFDASTAMQGRTSSNGEGVVREDQTLAPAELNVIDLDAPVSRPDPAIDMAIIGGLTTPPLDNFLSRRTRLHTQALSSADVFGDIWNIPLIPTYLADPNIAAKLQNYTFLRGTFEVTFVIATTPGAFGMYAITAVPKAFETTSATAQRYGSAATQPTCLSLYNALAPDNCAVFDAAISNTIILTLPFTHIYDSATLATYDNWNCQITCFQALSSGMNASYTQASMTVYGRFLPGYELSVPNYQAGNNANPKPSKMLAAVSSAADTLSVIPIIAPVMSLVSKGAKFVGNLAASFGFTVITQPDDNPKYFAMRSVCNVANVEGSDTGMVAALSQVARISNDPRIHGGDGKDELSFACLFPRKVFVTRVQYATNSQTGAPLLTIPVTPMYCNMGYGSSLTTAFYPTVAGYTGLLFDYWRGSITYHVYVPVSKFHRGRLQAIWSSSFPTGSSTDMTSTTYSHIWDVTPGKWMTFTVGYQSNRPMLRTLLTNGLMTAPAPPLPPAECFNGYFTLRAVTPLESVSGSAATEILVFQSASADMEFAMPTLDRYYLVNNAGTTEYLFAPVAQLRYQSGALGDETAIEDVDVVLVPHSAPYPIAEVLYGESFNSVRAYMQKPTNYRSLGTTVPNPGVVQFFPISGPPSATWEGQSWATHFARLFYSVATSERVKIVDAANESAYAIFKTAFSGYPTPHSFGQLAPLTFIGGQRGLEVTLPYYNTTRFVYGCYNYDTNISTPAPISIGMTNAINVINDTGYGGPATVPAPVLFHSFGDDIRVAHFCGVPNMIANGPFTQSAGYIYGAFN